MIEDLVRRYLPQFNVMQLATSVEDQPWICTVHYYTDEKLNFYWISNMNRRHSKEIQNNPKVTAYVLVHENTADEEYVIGVSISGQAKIIKNGLKEEISSAYLKKLNKDPEFVAGALKTEGSDKFYRLKPEKIVLFDTKNLSGNPRQEWTLV